MQRAVFDRSIIDGYRTSKTESIAVTAHGRRMFAGTSDGAIVVYDCRPDTVGSTSKLTQYIVQCLCFCSKLDEMFIFQDIRALWRTRFVSRRKRSPAMI